MIRLGRWAALAAIVASFPQQAIAAPREPTGKWVVNFDEAQCVAQRDYGTADEPLTLMLKAPATGDVLQLFVVRKGPVRNSAEQLNGRLRVGDGPVKQLTALAYSPAKKPLRVFLYNLPRAEVSAWPTSTTLDVRADVGLKDQLALTGLHPLLKVMDECVADLRTHWNYSDDKIPSKHRERASANLISVFRWTDYPGVSLSNSQEGITSVVLLIDEAGKVADCTLVKTSGVAALDAQTCILIQERARFRPATGMDGKPAKDVFFKRVGWRIE